jgi:diguanylate cyclase (GGDEF)-like protein
LKSEGEILQQVNIEKTALLFRENRQGLFMSLFVASIVSSVVALEVGVVPSLVWWLIMSSILLSRMLVFVRFQTQVKLTADNVAYWNKMFVTGSAIYGLSWGLGVPYFAGDVSFEVMLLCVMVMISLCVGAVPYLFYSLLAVESYLLTILGPITIWLFAQGGLTEGLAGLTCLIFAISTYLMARKLNILMTNTMRLQLENASLSNELIKANYELKALSSTDLLSGIANRRAFEKEFDKMLAQGRRDDQCMSVLMMDIDHFKQFNDTYGHLAGDKIIHWVAQALKQQLKRPADMVARYGGEEFIVMLPGTDEEGAVQVADAMRAAIQNLDVSEVVDKGGRVTLSAGVICRSAQEAETLLDFVRWADQALYAAKDAGRNCTKVQMAE